MGSLTSWLISYSSLRRSVPCSDTYWQILSSCPVREAPKVNIDCPRLTSPAQVFHMGWRIGLTRKGSPPYPLPTALSHPLLLPMSTEALSFGVLQKSSLTFNTLPQQFSLPQHPPAPFVRQSTSLHPETHGFPSPAF